MTEPTLTPEEALESLEADLKSPEFCASRFNTFDVEGASIEGDTLTVSLPCTQRFVNTFEDIYLHAKEGADLTAAYASLGLTQEEASTLTMNILDKLLTQVGQESPTLRRARR